MKLPIALPILIIFLNFALAEATKQDSLGRRKLTAKNFNLFHQQTSYKIVRA